MVVTTNLNVIIADIYYKNGDAYDKSGRWDGSVPAYQQALKLAPSQDFYYLFLGRAYMELAKRVADAQRAPATYTVNDLMTMTSAQLQRMSRQDMLNASLTSLLEARRLNPLNTDHTANLGRLYRFWGEIGDAKHARHVARVVPPGHRDQPQHGPPVRRMGAGVLCQGPVPGSPGQAAEERGARPPVSADLRLSGRRLPGAQSAAGGAARPTFKPSSWTRLR